MQKTFKNQQGRLFKFVPVPSGYEHRIIDDDNFIVGTFRHPNGAVRKHCQYLGSGNYQTLCIAKDATEDEAAIIVQGMAAGSWGRWYRNYLAKHEEFSFDIASESLTSLLTSLGFKDDNVLILEKI